MCKRLLVCFVVLLLAGTISFAANPVGIFDDTTDVGTGGNPRGIGIVQQIGDNYRMTGGGSDVWDQQDHMLFAYKGLAGDWRVAADFAWQTAGDWWSKTGVMVRASTAAESAYFGTMIPNTLQGHNETIMQGRNSTWDWTWGSGTGTATTPAKLAIQRFNIVGPISIVESLADFGSGWQMIGSAVTTNIPETAQYGAFVTSHNNDWMAQVNVSNVTYTEHPQMFTQITTLSNPDGTCPQQPGFMIRTIRSGLYNPPGWGYAGAAELLSTGEFPAGVPGEDEETRYDKYVNLYDSGGRGEFSAGNGYPDVTFPGIDAYIVDPTEPADGDVDEYFATEVKACIQLTAGYHVIGVNSDDGTIVKIGGIEVGRSAEWKGTSTDGFVFNVLTPGLYSLEALNMQGGGGAALELLEFVGSGWVLMGDVDRGASPVYVPEPATIALLGLGGMSLLGIRRKR